jgi:alpha-L-fucosidase
MKSSVLLAVGVAVLLGGNPTGLAQPYEAAWESLDRRPIPSWFPEAKFGIFIHWGVYSVPAWRPLSERRYASYAEWYYARVLGDREHGGDAFHRRNYGEEFEYRDFAPMFRAELFDPDAWAELFERAGARYVVLTSKHHDGFCLWPTKSPFKKGWNSLDVGPKRDLLGELTAAVRKRGLRMGLYYSIIEWESVPTGRTESGWFLDPKTVEKYRIPEDRYVTEHLLPQLRELVTEYRPAVIFADGGEWDFDEDHWKTKEFLAWLYNEAPNRDEVVVNDRWCKGMPGKHGDYFSSEYQDADAVGVGHPWEESRGIGGSYGFNRAENLDDYRTSKELIQELVDIVSRGGNLLLNVGPTADGRIPVIMQQRLADIGDWLRVNGEAIYGTSSWTPSKIEDGGAGVTVHFTRKGRDLFALCLGWPTGEWTIPRVRVSDGVAVRLLGSEVTVEWTASDDGIRITPPRISPADVPCDHAYVFRIENVAR